jgi:hypothetical protein
LRGLSLVELSSEWTGLTTSYGVQHKKHLCAVACDAGSSWSCRGSLDGVLVVSVGAVGGLGSSHIEKGGSCDSLGSYSGGKTGITFGVIVSKSLWCGRVASVRSWQAATVAEHTFDGVGAQP